MNTQLPAVPFIGAQAVTATSVEHGPVTLTKDVVYDIINDHLNNYFDDCAIGLTLIFDAYKPSLYIELRSIDPDKAPVEVLNLYDEYLGFFKDGATIEATRGADYLINKQRTVDALRQLASDIEALA